VLAAAQRAAAERGTAVDELRTPCATAGWVQEEGGRGAQGRAKAGAQQS
jgi:hypothetical protein